MRGPLVRAALSLDHKTDRTAGWGSNDKEHKGATFQFVSISVENVGSYEVLALAVLPISRAEVAPERRLEPLFVHALSILLMP